MIKKADANQAQIVKALRQIGASVYPTHMVGKGFPDLVVGFRGVNYLFEVKDGNKPPSKRKLTPDETEFHNTWTGKVYIVNNIDEALKILTK